MLNTLFRIKDFRLLLSAQIIAVLGDWFGIIAIIALVGFRWQATPIQMSMVVFSMAAPMLLLGPMLGVLADRVERGRMMAVTNILRSVILLLITTAGNFTLLCLLAMVLGLLDAAFIPAKNAKLKEIVPPGLINDAVIYSSFVDQGAKVFGPALGGSLLAVFGVETAIYINAAAYIVSTAILLFLSYIKHAAPVGEGSLKNIASELKEGFNIMKKAPFVLYGAFIQIFVVFTVQVVDSQFVVLLRSVPSAEEAWVGYCLMAAGVGSILTTYFYLKSHRDFDVRHSLLLGVIVYSGAILGISIWGKYGSHPAGFLPFFLLWGVSGALIFVKFNTYIQEKIPVDYSGRAFGALGSMLSGASLCGLLSGGLLVSALGASTTFFLAGLLMIIGGLYLKSRLFS